MGKDAKETSELVDSDPNRRMGECWQDGDVKILTKTLSGKECPLGKGLILKDIAECSSGKKKEKIKKRRYVNNHDHQDDTSMRNSLSDTRLETTESAALSSPPGRKRRNVKCNDVLPDIVSSNPMESDSFTQPPVHTSVKAYLSVTQYDAGVNLSQDMNKEKEEKKRENASKSNTFKRRKVGLNTSCRVAEKVNSCTTSPNKSPAKKHDDNGEVDMTSVEPTDSQTNKRKKGFKTYRRKKRKVSHPLGNSLECVNKHVGSSVLNNLEYTSLDSSDESLASGSSKKMLEREKGAAYNTLLQIVEKREVMATDSTLLQVVEDISTEKSSDGCSDGEPAFEESEESKKSSDREPTSEESKKRIEMETLKQTIDEDGFVNNGSAVDLLDENSEKANGVKININQNAVQDTYSVSDMENAISSSSQLCEMKDDIGLVISKEDDLIVHSSPKRALACHFRRKLLILDVNGLLADIVSYVSYGYEADTIIGKKAVFRRPFCDDFLQFCFERFNVGVWSSRTKRNVESVLDFLMRATKHNLLFCWDQSQCTDTGYNTVENREKPLLLKELKKLWEKQEPNLPWERGDYDESNTLLLDDSPYKALCNPLYTAIFPHSYRYKDVKDNSLGPGGDLRVYLERLSLAENVQKYVEQNPFGQRPITERNLSWSYYLKVIGTVSSRKQKNDSNSSSLVDSNRLCRTSHI